jgi:DNA-binding LytR/AlgR family response regulator
MKSGPALWKCLVVDDEPLAAELVQTYIEAVPELELVAVCSNALEAGAILRRQTVDVLFLDIQMPQLTGLEFIRTLSHPPAVIFTTAYREYAVEGFELDAADYLVKPISLERFLKAVQKLLRREIPPALVQEAVPEAPYVYYRVDRQQVKVYLNDILWIESQKDYIKLVLEGGKTLLTYQRISYAEEALPASLFLRIHRSFIVAKKKVTAVKGDEVWIGTQALPVGNSYKQKVQQEILK